MTRDDIGRIVREVLARVAPDADLGAVRPDESLREQLDIDSIDFLRAVAAIGARLGVEIPETAYAELDTLDGAIDWLAARA